MRNLRGLVTRRRSSASRTILPLALRGIAMQCTSRGRGATGAAGTLDLLRTGADVVARDERRTTSLGIKLANHRASRLVDHRAAPPTSAGDASADLIMYFERPTGSAAGGRALNSRPCGTGRRGNPSRSPPARSSNH
jgi:hypothetical protein